MLLLNTDPRAGLNIFISVLLGCLLIAVLLLNLEPKAIHSELTNPHIPQAYMRGVQATRFDQTGQISEIVMVNSLSYFALAHQTQLIEPVLTRYKNQIPVWTIHARTGTGFHPNKSVSLEKLTLREEVAIEQVSQHTTAPLRLYTNQLELTRQVGKTNDPVVIRGAGVNQIKSHGLIANFETGEIKLLNRVDGVYDQTQL